MEEVALEESIETSFLVPTKTTSSTALVNTSSLSTTRLTSFPLALYLKDWRFDLLTITTPLVLTTRSPSLEMDQALYNVEFDFFFFNFFSRMLIQFFRISINQRYVVLEDLYILLQFNKFQFVYLLNIVKFCSFSICCFISLSCMVLLAFSRERY